MRATYKKYILDFKRPSGTSRGVMTEKETWFIKIEQDGKYGIGECGILRGLSIDDRPDYEEKLNWVGNNIHLGEDKLWEELIEFPSIQFGLETAFASFKSDDPYILFPSEFTSGSANIPINGLVWMGSEGYMKDQIEEKIEQGFSCMLQLIRANFTPEQIEIRVDANGAFSDDAALNKLNQLYIYQLHSIEQPIKAGNLEAMSQLCKSTPLPIALDEELIGIFTYEDKEALLAKIQPQFIILKPSLVGGFRGCAEWIALAEKHKIGWWVTSALESNIGLNAIAQWTFTKNNPMPQGLGTGSLYTNNFNCPLEVKNGQLCYNPQEIWELSL
jgi:O-succinylbenzoate synthase